MKNALNILRPVECEDGTGNQEKKKFKTQEKYEGQSISNASYVFHLYFSRKLKYNYIAWKPQHWRLICHFSI